MKTIDATALADMTVSILERTAMVTAEPATEGHVHPRPTRFARIAYRGPSRGTLVVGANDGFLREFAAGMLGIENADVDVASQGDDVLTEMANTLGGSVILALSGDSCEYLLGLPELVPAADVSAATGAACTVVTECGVLNVRWNGDRSLTPV